MVNTPELENLKQPFWDREEIRLGELVIIIFEKQDAAKKVLDQLKKRSFQGIVDLEGAVVAERDELGITKVSNLGNIALEHSAGGTAFGVILGTVFGGIAGAGPVGAGIGAAIGAGAGIVTGLFEQASDENDVLRDIAKELKPESSALGVVLFVNDMDRATLLADLEGLDGKVIRSTLSAKNKADLVKQLEQNSGAKFSV